MWKKILLAPLGRRQYTICYLVYWAVVIACNLAIHNEAIPQGGAGAVAALVLTSAFLLITTNRRLEDIGFGGLRGLAVCLFLVASLPLTGGLVVLLLGIFLCIKKGKPRKKRKQAAVQA